MRVVYPCLSKEGQKKIDAVFREYGIGGRALTEEEVTQAGDMVVEIVRKYHIHPS